MFGSQRRETPQCVTAFALLVSGLKAHLNVGPSTVSDYRKANDVGGKNSSLGKSFAALKPQGVGVLDGFATTAGESLQVDLILRSNMT